MSEGVEVPMGDLDKRTQSGHSWLSLLLVLVFSIYKVYHDRGRRPVVVVGVPLRTTVVIIISELWVGCNAFNSLHLLGSITHSASGKSPIVTFDSLLPLSVLVFSSFNVYKMGFRFNICPGLILDCCFWAGWYALSCLLSNNNPFAATTIFAAGASFFELLWQLKDWHPEGYRLSVCLANFVSGVWFHYATTRPLFMTPRPSFFNILTFIFSASLSTLKVSFPLYDAFPDPDEEEY